MEDQLNIHLENNQKLKTINGLDTEKVLDKNYYEHCIALCVHVDSKSISPLYLFTRCLSSY